jgi:hypothetical protein
VKKTGKALLRLGMKRLCLFKLWVVFLLVWCGSAAAFDADISRQSLKGLRGVHVVIEELNANLMKYAKAQKVSLDKAQIKAAVEKRLQSSGIKVLSLQDMLNTPGKPVFYVSINTHEYEKYWYAYDIRTEVQQMASLESRPGMRMNAATWSLNMTGVVNIGTMNRLQSNLDVLVDRFIAAYKTAQTMGVPGEKSETGEKGEKGKLHP